MARNNDPLNPEVLGEDDDMPGQEMGLDAITRSEIDMQIATAKRYPRNIARVKANILAMATLDEDTAAACFYSLDRKGEGGKKGLIQGPSIRMAEIAMTQYQNLRAATRGLGETEDGRFVRELGVCHDVENNVMVAREVRRRITNRDGRRYGDDMVGVTMAAAAAIALRNAVFTIVPRAIIKPAYEAAKDVALGKTKSLTLRRTEILDRLRKRSPLITTERVLARMERRAIDELTWDDLELLIGLGTSIKDGMMSVEEAFPDPSSGTTSVGEILNGAGVGTQGTAGNETTPDSPEVAARRGKLARQGNHARDTCPYPAGPLADAWTAAWDAETPIGTGTTATSSQAAPEAATTPAGEGTATHLDEAPQGQQDDTSGGGGSLFDDGGGGTAGGGRKTKR
jgi:hypothetical protein